MPETLFPNSSLPIHLDIGSARGKFLISMASKNKSINYLGLEIRNSLVISSEKERLSQDITNLRFLFCNVNVSLVDWLQNLPKGLLRYVSIQFPDPWFKKRHKKRSVLQPDLLLGITRALDQGSLFFIQSDILDVADSMTALIERTQCFKRQEGLSNNWLLNSPFPVKTERENYADLNGLPIYRSVFYRNTNSPPKLNRSC